MTKNIKAKKYVRTQPSPVASFLRWIVAIPSMLGIFALLAYLINFHTQKISESVEQWGQSGDYFGGILNPIFAFASLLVVCRTLWLQFTNSSENARFNAIQQLESLLFELLRLHRDNLSSIDLWDDDRKRETRGRDCFSAFTGWIRNNHARASRNHPTEKSLAEAYRIFYEDHRRKTEVGHYFRNLYHIFKYIDENPLLTPHEKMKYAKLVRAQLSTPETALLFYNGLHPAGRAFRKYIERYSLLQELKPEDLGITGLTYAVMNEIYSEEAFTEAEPAPHDSK